MWWSGQWATNIVNPSVSVGGFISQNAGGSVAINANNQNPGVFTINLPAGNTNDILDVVSNHVVQMRIDRGYNLTAPGGNVLVTTAFVTNSPYVVSTNTHVVNFYFTNGLIVLPSNSPAGLFYTIASMNTNGSCTVSNPLGNCLLPGIGISNVFQLGGANSPSNMWSGASLGDQNFN